MQSRTCKSMQVHEEGRRECARPRKCEQERAGAGPQPSMLRLCAAARRHSRHRAPPPTPQQTPWGSPVWGPPHPNSTGAAAGSPRRPWPWWSHLHRTTTAEPWPRASEEMELKGPREPLTCILSPGARRPFKSPSAAPAPSKQPRLAEPRCHQHLPVGGCHCSRSAAGMPGEPGCQPHHEHPAAGARAASPSPAGGSAP